MEGTFVEIHGAYCHNEDITVIIKETTRLDGEPISTEIVGFYYGEPDEECTRYFVGSLKATYSED